MAALPGTFPFERARRVTSIRLHPKVLAWARREARRRKVGYQTVINEALLEKAG
jgi:hypothetical protein